MSTSLRANGHVEDCACSDCDALYYQAIAPSPAEEAAWARIKDLPETQAALKAAGLGDPTQV